MANNNKIMSLNARGLRDIRKRSNLFFFGLKKNSLINVFFKKHTGLLT